MTSRSLTRGICTICSSHHRLIPSSSRLTLRPFTSTPPSARVTTPRPGRPLQFGNSGNGSAGRQQTAPRLSPRDYAIAPPPKPAQVAKAILARIDEWSDSDRTAEKLAAYGLTGDPARTSLQRWRRDVVASLVESTDKKLALEKGGWQLSRLTDGLQSEDWVEVYESSLHRHFLQYLVTSPPSELIPQATLTHIASILSTTDLTRLPFLSMNLPARTISRHFHLHVGPTNSGKTYSALKALALAPRGAYAGPLRLLAHEVWERLNLGTVGGLDGVGRACNLITGEERRIVDEDSGLVSCTVEMLPVSTNDGQPFDVVVIDEIQMMGDTQRGGSWTSAVLSVMAKEVHLCGDDTTVELLSKLIPSLGDRMTIHRYERLTPLEVSQESLRSSWEEVRAGDCIVTFSRTNIFAVKKMVEAKAGKKCAVVYGALPPETRAEQAREFNEGRAEVLVASDAVGMGLNLKIKRMIFESLHKFNGKAEIPLPLTSVKQIAGRAGRFGMHKSTPALDADTDPSADPSLKAKEVDTSGSVTTLHAVDLPILRQLLPLPLPSLPRAALDIPFETIAILSSLLPNSTTYSQLLSHLANLILPPAHTTLGGISHKLPLADVVEEHRDRLSLAEIELFCFAPISTRDKISVQIFRNIIAHYANNGHVDFEMCFGPSMLVDVLERCEMALMKHEKVDPDHHGSPKRKLVPGVLVSSPPLLETLHKTLVCYIWLGFRFPIAFPDMAMAQNLKTRVEGVLENCLTMIPGLKKPKATLEVVKAKTKTQKKKAQVDEENRQREWARIERDKLIERGEEAGEGRVRVKYVGKDEGERRKKQELWSGIGVVREDRAPSGQAAGVGAGR